MSYTGPKREILFLDTVRWLCDEICNYVILDIIGSGEHSNILFHTEVHQRVFFITLVDLLSPSDPNTIGEATPYLRALAEVCENPFFQNGDSLRLLKETVEAFRAWLVEPVEIKFWLATVEVEDTLTLTRAEMIKAAGNIVKHNHTRLWGIAKVFDDALRAKGHSYDKGQFLLDLHEGFYFRLYEDIGNYHASTIAEFVNNIRWGIHEYLRPECARAYRKVGSGFDGAYTFDVPAVLSDDEFIRGLYWRLMNSVRSKPIVPRFTVTEWLKKRH